MRTITKKYDVYKFDELDERTQEKIICDYLDFNYCNIDITKLHKNSNLYKAFKKAEDLQTPWFIEQFIWDYCKKDILKDIKKYEYYKNGGLYYED